MLDKADLGYVKIMASSDLDEYIIRDLNNADASREILGLGQGCQPVIRKQH